jgi:D-3-phosphoglycerate dehydrogenase
LFGKASPRLVEIDGFQLEAIPSGHMVVILGEDVPGVIGAIGTALGERGINIASLANGRREIGGQALTVVNVDTPLGEPALGDLAKLANVIWARLVRMPKAANSSVSAPSVDAEQNGP